ncbi:MAG: hypothetical protein A2087_08075 [Spirochaetes bacterium GWD1_61_31]|nr:MAG: hypothetical protein A2087_08075 [Spirochaetes bacterium GWD1_61_31]OHD43943.1 MAG: hypothetical protein A2Y35_08730 [Spirochaetes bacterium GWE1_60_18]HAP42656.1 hypothetical protein [Spirochaetaceae bacterium]HAW85479.1 hypothetical protein [Spirochaetaceae bacterium]HAX37569.1 hypothetical protein [Spirochaetaceae bacterium]
MTAREKALGTVFLALLAVCLTGLNGYTALGARQAALRRQEQYEGSRPLAVRAAASIAEARAKLALLESRSPAPSASTDPYSLGSDARRVLERAGAAIKSFSLAGTAERPVLETAVQAESTFMTAFWPVLDAAQPALEVDNFTVTVGRDARLEIVLRMAYAGSE